MTDSRERHLLQELVRRQWVRAQQIPHILDELRRRRATGQPRLTLESLLSESGLLSAAQLDTLRSGSGADRESGTGSGHSSGRRRSGLPGPGEKLDRFEVVRELGRGGMGIVLLVRDPELGRECALKVLRNPDSERQVKRFLREAEAAAALDHPNIVKLHVASSWNGLPFFTMDYVRGRSLSECMGDASLADVLGWVRDVARALQALHERDIVHRDVKPDNVLVDERGTAKLTDFGLSKILSGDQESLTRTGAVMGTPYYLSPEQARGETKTVDARSDVFSLGIVLYECLTGERPFAATRVMELYSRIIQTDPLPPSELNPAVTGPMERVCLRALEKDPDDRYPTAAAFADDLDRILAGVGETVTAPKRAGAGAFLRRHGIKLLMLLGLVVGAGVGGSWLLERWERSDRARKRAERLLEAEGDLTRAAGILREAGSALQSGQAEEAKDRLRVADGLLTGVEGFLAGIEGRSDEVEKRREQLERLRSRERVLTGRTLEAAGDAGEALLAYRSGYDLRPERETARRIARLAGNLLTPEKVVRVVAPLNERWEDVPIALVQAEALRAMGESQGALSVLAPHRGRSDEADRLGIRCLLDLDRIEDATQAVDELLARGDDGPDALLLFARIQWRRNKRRPALETATNALRVRPDHRATRRFRGRIALEMGFEEQGLADLRPVLEERLERSLLPEVLERAVNRHELGWAGRLLERARERFDPWPGLVVQEARWAFWSGREDRLTELLPRVPGTWRRRIELRRAIEEESPAASTVDLCRRALEKGTTPEEFLLAGIAAVRLAERDLAEEAFRRVEEAEPSLLPLVRIWRSRLSGAEERQESLDWDVLCTPFWSVWRLARRATGYARLTRRPADRRRADALLKRAIRQYPGFAAPRIELANFLLRTEPGRARRHLEAARRLDDENPEIHGLLGRLDLAEDEAEKAVKTLTSGLARATRVDERIAIERLLAQAQLRAGRVKTAIERCEALAERVDRPSRLWKQMAKVAREAGRKTLAEELIERTARVRDARLSRIRTNVRAISERLEEKQEATRSDEAGLIRAFEETPYATRRPFPAWEQLLSVRFREGAFDRWAVALFFRVDWHLDSILDANVNFTDFTRTWKPGPIVERLRDALKEGMPPFEPYYVHGARGVCLLYMAYFKSAPLGEGRKELLRAIDRRPDALVPWIFLSMTDLQEGWTQIGEDRFQALWAPRTKEWALPYMHAVGHGLAGNPELCLDWLDVLKKEKPGIPKAGYLKHTAFDGVRDRVRFRNLHR